MASFVFLGGYHEIVPQAKLADGVGKRCFQPAEGADGLMQPNCQPQGMGRGD